MTTEPQTPNPGPDGVRVIKLRDVPRYETETGRWRIKEVLWRLVEFAVVANSLQPSSSFRAKALRAFGAHVGSGVIIRPRTRVRFPWNLSVGDDCWIGEGVWISNREHITMEPNVVISQGTFITTGSHSASTDMRETAAPVHIEAGSWITARCVILGGVRIGRSALVTPGTVVSVSVPAGVVFGQKKPQVLRDRFPDEST